MHLTPFLQEPGNYLRTKYPYSQGNALYAFDLSPDLANKTTNLQKQGSVRLVLKFRQALADNVSVIAYAEFEYVIEIDHNHIDTVHIIVTVYLEIET